MNHSHKDTLKVGSQLPQIAIEKMTDADIDSYCQLFQSVFSHHPWNEEWTIVKINANVKKLMCKNGFFGMVAKNASGNIGYLTGFRLKLFPSVFYIDQLFIDTNYHGKKIGTRLLSETTSQLKSLGVCKLLLLTKPNSDAQEFYRNNGYKRFLSPICIKHKAIFYKKI
jgi:ribosomal protein S18 acetylase RimI-like enzyme